MKKLSNVLWITLLLTLLFAGAAAAVVDIQESAVTWTTETDGSLRITGPESFVLDRELKAHEAFSLTPFDDAGKLLADGLYRWNVAALSPTAPISTRTNLVSEVKRGLGKTGLRTGEMESGYFTLAGSVFVTATFEEVDYNKDQVILDDLIVDGSACVGQDCVNGESFGFDTIRMKENNLRLKCQDTSSTASFPTNDWQMTCNDSSNGGANKFSIDDIDGGRTPFTLEAGAPSHSLYVDDGGRLGLGTNTPVVDVHVVSGNTPTLRLEQNGSSGFGPQTWDVAGNEANFFIRDATNGSTLPFRIFPSAPSNALTIEGTTGDIGLGTTSPDASLDVTRSDGTTKVLIEETTGTGGGRLLLELINNGPVRVDQSDTSSGVIWRATNGGSNYSLIDLSDAATVEFQLAQSGDLTISGDYFSTTCGTPCAPDYVFEPEYELLPLEDLESFIQQNKHLPNVPSAEELTGPINMSKLQMTLLEKIEELTLYTLTQQKTIEDLRDRLAAMEEVAQE